jgi:hypothetical protein
VVLLEIDAESISRVDFEGDAPRTIDVDGVTGGNKTFQDMKIKPGKVHLLRRSCGIQAIKTDQDALVHLGIDLRRPAFRPQIGERLASKRPITTQM